MAQQDDPEVLGHGDEYDGIEEYDNKLPMWWLGILYFSIAWAGFYVVKYHFIDGDSQTKRYEDQMAQAEAKWPAMDMSTIVLADVDADAGRAVYTTNCVACHKEDLTGGIGANLTDAEWVHGNSFENIMGTIDKGVAAKGMPAWGDILGAEKVAQVAKYVFEKSGAVNQEAVAPAAAGGGGAEGAGNAEAGMAAAEALAAGGAAAGEALFNGMGACSACHSVDGTQGVGPSMKDKVGSEETMADGTTVMVDRDYVLESIREPNAKVVKDFAPAMPARPDLSEEQVGQIYEYLESLSQHAAADGAGDDAAEGDAG